MLKCTHNFGFFSCCSVKLNDIIDYFNYHKNIPNEVDSSAQFEWYKINKTGDITYDYFEHYNNINNNDNLNTIIKTTNYIDYNNHKQFVNYATLDYNTINPFIKKYFSPSKEINTMIETIEKKYNIGVNSSSNSVIDTIDYNNICVLFYRGNDKNTETIICNYNEYIDKAKIILKSNPTIQFLIQSDETEFIDIFTALFPNNSFYFKDEIRHIKKCNSTVDKVMREQNYLFSKYYLAITIIMSKCKYIVCGSGNCSMWIMFYRGHSNNIYQNLNTQWIDLLIPETILLFNKVCLYDECKNETLLYGQYKKKFNTITIISNDIITHNLVFCDSRPDFYIKLNGKLSNIDKISFNYDANTTNTNSKIEFTTLKLYYPFENCDLQLDKNTSSIISTICKDYTHRLDEWIHYNLKLGFSGIIIFNNDENKSNELHELLDNCILDSTISELCKKYKGKVFEVKCPYTNLPGGYWTDIQRMTLHIGVNAFRDKCRNIALIDADEFIYFPKNPTMKIEDFLQHYNTTITMKSNILTNKNENDIINNNILAIANYIGEDKYTKTILNTNKIQEHEFIVTPHEHDTQCILDKSDIIHYHVWINKRYNYNESMKYISLIDK
jgi:hypothetical protein